MKINCMVMICRKITEAFQLSAQGGVCGAACRTVCGWRQVDALFLDWWKDSCWCFCCYLLLSPVCLLLLTWTISSCMLHHRVHRTDAPLWSVCATIVEHLHNSDFDSCSVHPYLACVCVTEDKPVAVGAFPQQWLVCTFPLFSSCYVQLSIVVWFHVGHCYSW